MNLSDIKAKLTSAFRVSELAEEINEQSVKEICNRRVNFTLVSDDEKSLKKAGASDLLIKTIRENSPEEAKEMILLYQKYEAYYDPPNIEQKKIALDAAKEFVRKYENSVCLKEQVNYFKEAIPALESAIRAYDPRPDLDPRRDEIKRLIKFDNAYKSKNWDETFDIGAEVLKDQPDFVDVAIFLASVGYDQAMKLKEKSKYDDKAIYYAELAIKMIEANVESKTGDYGGYEFKYKTEKFPNGKSNALGWMNYIIGIIKSARLNQVNEAIPYLYKSIKYDSETKEFAETYQAIGAWYLDKVVVLGHKRLDLEKTDAEKSFDILAIEKAYADRAIDASARAYNITQSKPKADKRAANDIFNKLKKLFASRYGREVESDDKLKEFISIITANPMPDPATEVVPIK